MCISKNQLNIRVVKKKYVYFNLSNNSIWCFFYDKKKWKCKYVYKLFRIYANLVDSMHNLCIIWEIVSIQVNDNPSLLKPSIHRITNQGIKETIIRVYTLLKRNKQCLPWLRMNQEGKVRERFFRRSWNVNAIDRWKTRVYSK